MFVSKIANHPSTANKVVERTLHEKENFHLNRDVGLMWHKVNVIRCHLRGKKLLAILDFLS